MKRTMTRVEGQKFCTVDVLLEDGRIAISGSTGRVVTRAAAKKEALAYWISYFEDDGEVPGTGVLANVAEMNARCGTKFRSARAAAAYVLETGGELDGLDVHEVRDAARPGLVLIVESSGQIVDALATWFPEVTPFLRYHLNDMRPGCEHQEAAGWAERPIDPTKPTTAYGRHFDGQRSDSWNMLAWVTREEHPEGLLSHPCPACGYRYGSAWLRRELPAEVIAWAESFGHAAGEVAA